MPNTESTSELVLELTTSDMTSPLGGCEEVSRLQPADITSITSMAIMMICLKYLFMNYPASVIDIYRTFASIIIYLHVINNDLLLAAAILLLVFHNIIM